MTFNVLAQDNLKVAIPVTVHDKGIITIKPINNDIKAEQSELNIEGDGQFILNYTEPGDYKYLITQQVGNNRAIIYDSKNYYVTVSVISENNVLNSNIIITTDNKVKIDKIEFTNKRIIETIKNSPTPEPNKQQDKNECPNCVTPEPTWKNTNTANTNSYMPYILLSLSAIILSIITVKNKKNK